MLSPKEVRCIIYAKGEGEGLDRQRKDLFDQLSEQLKPNVENDLVRFRKDIQEMLELEIVKRYYYQNGAIEYGLRTDNWLKTAIEIIKK